jgi:hypothetical protein
MFDFDPRDRDEDVATLRCRGQRYVMSLDVIANQTIPATVAT